MSESQDELSVQRATLEPESGNLESGAKPVRPQDKMQLPHSEQFFIGSGIDPANGFAYGTPFIYPSGAAPTLETFINGQEVRASIFNTESGRSRHVDLAMSADVQAWGSEFSLSTSFVSSRAVNETHMTMMFHKKVDKSKTRFDVFNQDLVLPDHVVEWLRTDPKQFVDIFGPFMIASIDHGCFFDGAVEIDTGSVESALETATELHGEWASFGASGSVGANLETTFTTYNKTNSIEVAGDGVGYMGDINVPVSEDVRTFPHEANKPCTGTPLTIHTTSWSEVKMIADILVTEDGDDSMREALIFQQDIALARKNLSEAAYLGDRALELANDKWQSRKLKEEISALLVEIADTASEGDEPDYDVSVEYLEDVEELLEQSDLYQEPLVASVGSGKIESEVQMDLGFAAVGLGANVSNEAFQMIKLVGREIGSDGLGPEATFKGGISPGSAPELSCKAPDGHLLTAVGFGVREDGVRSIYIESRLFDPEMGRLTGSAVVKRCGQGGPERTIRVDDYETAQTQDQLVIVGVGAREDDYDNAESITLQMRPVW